MRPASAVAICAALLCASLAERDACADVPSAPEAVQAVDESSTSLSGRVRTLGGLTHETGGTTSDDLWLGIRPELVLLLVEPRWQLRSAYALTAAAHTLFANEIANRLALASIADLSSRTKLMLEAEGNHSTLSNLLLTRPATVTPVGALPSNDMRVLTASVAETVTWEASPIVGVDERLDASSADSFGASPAVHARFASLTLGVERAWKVDAIGAEAHGAYAYAATSTLGREVHLAVFTSGARVRHDFTPSLSGALTIGPSMIVGLDSGTRPKLVPAWRAALLYNELPARIELSYAHGFEPNVLTGQILRTHHVELRGWLPISVEERIVASAAAGYIHSTLFDLDRNGAPARSFDAALADMDLSWGATSWLQLFVRYQLLAQTRGATSASDPALVRHAAVIGVQLSSSSADPLGEPLHAPERVDRADIPH